MLYFILCICLTVLLIAGGIIGFMVWRTKQVCSCRHEWITVQEMKLSKRNDCIGKLYLQRCKHCGELKIYQYRVT